MEEDDNFGRNDKSIFQKIGTIGSGTYGVVYKGKNKNTNETIAIKKIKIDLENEGVPSTALREITILRELSHPNIVQLKDVVCGENKLYLLFEFLEYDLKRYMDEFNPLDEKTIKSFMYQIFDGVAYCHSKKIIHRDLKPQNLLIEKSGKVKIADFGLARSFSIPIRAYTKEVLTLWYRAPELLLGNSEYSISVDIWSIGCIFAEMYLKHPLFQGESEMEQWTKINEILGSPTPDSWPDIVKMPGYNGINLGYPGKKITEVIPNMNELAVDLLMGMLKYDPNKRITAKQALLHVSYI